MSTPCSVRLNRWFETPLGQRLLREEVQAMQQVLPQLFGYHLLQIGSVGHGDLLASSRIMHRCLLTSSTTSLTEKSYSTLYALPDALPFASDSLDVVVLPHVLEFEDYPHEILREVERILIPEGYVIILGFNPISLWGIWHWFWARRKSAPWCGRLLTMLRIKDWLTLLGFEVKEQRTFFFALPFKNDRFGKYTRLLENLGARWLTNFGAVYLIVAKRKVATLTPIKPIWLAQNAELVTGVVGSHFEEGK
jgi:SAM-dependent methyltransferase